jgi:hypothetical protein
MRSKIFLTGIFIIFNLCASAQNDVGIGTTNPQAKLDVRGNGITYDIFNASNDLAAPLDSILSLSKLGHLGIGTTNTGNYKIVAVGRPSAFSPQIEVWNGNPNSAGSILLGDLVDYGTPLNNGALNLYFNNNQAVAIRALGNSFINGGNVGIGIGMGTTLPNEMLHLGGALVVGAATNPVPVPGTIQWTGTGGNFMGYDGTGWVSLDQQVVTVPDWTIQGNPFGGPEIVPVQNGSTLSMGPLGAPNPGAMVWLPDLAVPGMTPVQLMLEGTSAGPVFFSNAAMIFRRSNWTQLPPQTLGEYWMGIYNTNNNFVLSNITPPAPSAQADGRTILTSSSAGIVDLPNQSRVRAIVPNIDWGSWQLVQPNTWTPINYTNPIPGTPLATGAPMWDEQGEFTNATSPNQVTPPVNAFFTATEAGFYQVNARCEFETDEYQDEGLTYPVVMRPNAYVSIAIYIDIAGGGANWLRFACGNNLQVTNNVLVSPPFPEYPGATQTLSNNNAPNVSDVVYLQPGDRVSIWAFHWAFTPMMIRAWQDGYLYFSIHKIS